MRIPPNGSSFLLAALMVAAISLLGLCLSESKLKVPSINESVPLVQHSNEAKDPKRALTREYRRERILASEPDLDEEVTDDSSKTPSDPKTVNQSGMASFYGAEFHRKPTASGETFDMFSMTAAHRSLPFDTWVRVTNQENHKFAIVRINNRGPFKKGRILDLSYAAAKKLEMIEDGVVPVLIEVVEEPKEETSYSVVGLP